MCLKFRGKWFIFLRQTLERDFPLHSSSTAQLNPAFFVFPLFLFTFPFHIPDMCETHHGPLTKRCSCDFWPIRTLSLKNPKTVATSPPHSTLFMCLWKKTWMEPDRVVTSWAGTVWWKRAINVSNIEELWHQISFVDTSYFKCLWANASIFVSWSKFTFQSQAQTLQDHLCSWHRLKHDGTARVHVKTRQTKSINTCKFTGRSKWVWWWDAF